ncbi:MAG: tetratricopeptide repeat protein [Bryobacteraceae bacterium]
MRRTDTSSCGVVDDATARRSLAKILSSPEFANASRLQQFLAYVVEQKLGGSESIKETELALQVFHRRSSFDRTGDSVVRVAASNLRSRLRDYYLRSGAEDPVTIELPKGSYVPVFQLRAAPPGSAQRWRIPAAWKVVAPAAVLLAGAAALWFTLGRSAESWSSIAVLPFLNLSGSDNTEYLAEGFVDEVTTALAQVDGLRVVARSSAFQFRGKSFDVRTAGRQLGVETLLEGSLRAAGTKIRVNAQLVKVADGFHIWSRVWEGDAGDLVTMEGDLAQSVARALRRPGIVKTRPARDQDAYDVYLKGQFFAERATPEDLRKSIGYLRDSVARDPTYAPAWAALADSYSSLAYHEVSPDPEEVAGAKDAAAKALALDGTLPEAHALLAFVRFFYDWNWAASESGLRRALQLDPNSARTHDWYAQLLVSEARFDEAVAEGRKAISLDPLNYRMSNNLAVVLYCAHRYGAAIDQARAALEINPHFPAAHTIAGASFQEKRQYGEAARQLRASLAEFPGDPDTIAHMAAVEFALGNREAVRQALAALENRPAHEPPAYNQMAYLYLVLGRRAEALTCLEKSYEQRSSDMVVLTVDPVFDSLHQDPRFLALQKKMGLIR